MLKLLNRLRSGYHINFLFLSLNFLFLCLNFLRVHVFNTAYKIERRCHLRTPRMIKSEWEAGNFVCAFKSRFVRFGVREHKFWTARGFRTLFSVRKRSNIVQNTSPTSNRLQKEIYSHPRNLESIVKVPSCFWFWKVFFKQNQAEKLSVTSSLTKT